MSFKIELNKKGVMKLLKSEQMQKIINNKKDIVKSNCLGSKSDSMVGKRRFNARVYSNNKNNELLVALMKARG